MKSTIFMLVLLLFMTGCQQQHQNVCAPLPIALFLDLAATPEWKAEHTVYAKWDNEKVRLPAFITFQSIPNIIGHGIFMNNGVVTMNYGNMNISLEVVPETRLNTVSTPFCEELRCDGLYYCAFQPFEGEGKLKEWPCPNYGELSKWAENSGEVELLLLDHP
jgi:hypothetical protein